MRVQATPSKDGMRRVLVLNSKGGCGKTTLATNLAASLAVTGQRVALADFDEQRSSHDWTRLRPDDRPPVLGLRAWKRGLDELPEGFGTVVIDAPARVGHKEMKRLVREADSVIVPMLPSMIDMRAAERFLEDLLDLGRIEKRKVRAGLVANRVDERTLVYGELKRFIEAYELPLLGSLRSAQCYVRAYRQGLGVLELGSRRSTVDHAQWAPILRWLRGDAGPMAAKAAPPLTGSP